MDIAYPFGVVGVVLFVQVLPRLLGRDIRVEMQKLADSVHLPEQTDLMVKDFVISQELYAVRLWQT